MSIPDPYSYLSEVARRLPTLSQREEIERILDEVEYLFEIIPPEMQDPAYQIIDQLRAKLETAAP